VTEQCKKPKQRRPGVPPGHLRPESPVIFSGIRTLRTMQQVAGDAHRTVAPRGVHNMKYLDAFIESLDLADFPCPEY
jgi:hypothetical protein